MPRELDRLRIEAALSLEMRTALVEACRLHEISRRDWLSEPSLRSFFLLAALYSEQERLMVEKGLKWQPALLDAAAKLGLDPSSELRAHYRRLRRRRVGDDLSFMPDADAA